MWDRAEHLDESAIREMIDSQQEEHLSLDFKEVHRPEFKNSEDKKDLARALSGFANSAGGVIVWGITAKSLTKGDPDVAQSALPVTNLPLFLSRLNSLTGEATLPRLDGVRHIPIYLDETTGFVITSVPPSDSGPHMAKLGEDRYYKRSGDSFYRMEHFDIADMFGRRPPPQLDLTVNVVPFGSTSGGQGQSWTGHAIVRLTNTGRALALAPFLDLKVKGGKLSQRGILDSGREGLPRVPASGSYLWNARYAGGRDTVIHPMTDLEVCAIRVTAAGPVNQPPVATRLELSYKVAAEGLPVKEGELSVSPEDIVEAIVEG